MNTPTAGLKCPVCGKWVSTDTPRSFGPRGGLASEVVGEELAVHLQIYHPDYLSWNRPYHMAWGVLFLTGLPLILCGLFLLNFSFFAVGLVSLLLPGIPLFVLYRRRFSEFKSHWAEEHPLAPTLLTPAAVPSVNRCRFCGEVIPMEKGLFLGFQDHYRSAHPSYYCWEHRRAPLVTGILFLAGVTILVLGLSIEPGQLSILGVAGFILLMALAMLYAFRGERKFKPTSPSKYS